MKLRLHLPHLLQRIIALFLDRPPLQVCKDGIENNGSSRDDARDDQNPIHKNTTNPLRGRLLHDHVHQSLRHDDHLDDFMTVDKALHFAVGENQLAQVGFRNVRRDDDF